MRHLLRSRATRSLCYALVLALLMTVAPAPFTQPAGAQLTPTYSVGVADFANESGVQGDLLSRLATDAVVVEMSKTNRYDVNITRTMIKTEMEKLDLHAPLDKLGLVRLGEALSADAMMEGSIKSVQLAGSGATRRASVTLVVQLIDQASGEIINGAVQTGTSSARVGYTPDDDSLITEAVNNAAFLAVKTMVDYIIPEATIMMNIGESQVMLNKGVRDGLKPGMRMIILRQKEIIGYIELRDVSPTDAIAKVTKSMRGIQPEDKARAIFEMPTVTGSAATAPLPSGAPSGGGGSKGAISKIGKFLLGAAILFGIASLFKGGRGNEDAPNSGALGSTDGIPTIRWDPTSYSHGKNVVELQVMRDGVEVVKTVRDPSAWDLGYTRLTDLYGTGAAAAVSYYRMDANPGTSYTETTANIAAEPFGVTHTYRIRVLYKQGVAGGGGSGDGDGDTATTQYFFSTLGTEITATAIEPVKVTDVLEPVYDPAAGPTEVLVSDLLQGHVNFQWNRKDGADIYYMTVEPVVAGTGRLWQSPNIPETGPVVTLPAAQRNALANHLATTSTADAVMRWRVYCKHQGDTSQVWVKGDESRFVIGSLPPGTP